jgi:luciferase family oxidoreductase group 1
VSATIPLNVLDLAPIPAGGTAVEALHNTLDLARAAEDSGYHRYWLAEHHFAQVASAASPVLIGQVLATTRRIRVGSAAVLIGFTTSIAVAEAFGTLAALYPGRVDLGIGRTGQRLTEAPAGRPQPNPEVVAGYRALFHPGATPPPFPEQVAQLQSLIDGDYRIDGRALRSPVAEAASGPIWIFGSSAGESAQVAAARGLPFVANYHVSPGTTDEAVAAYRAAFVPSPDSPAPYVVVSADVLVAATGAEATELAAGYPAWVHSIRYGAGAIAYPRTSDDLTAAQRAAVADRTDTRFVGTPDSVASRLRELAARTGADELVITSVTWDHQARRRSHQLLAKEWGASR